MTTDRHRIQPATPEAPELAHRSLKRMLVLYVVLVIGPFIALLGILRIGRGITPPISVGGRWVLTAALPAGQGTACLGLEPSDARLAFSISQSGRQLAIKLGDSGPSSTRGELDGTRVRALVPQEEATGGAADACPGARGLRIESWVDRSTDPVRMTGELRAAGCSSCATLPFSAELTSSKG